MNQQEMQAIASAAANSVVDSIVGELVRRLAQAEARAAVAETQVQAMRERVSPSAAGTSGEPTSS